MDGPAGSSWAPPCQGALQSRPRSPPSAALRLSKRHAVGPRAPPENLRQLPEAGKVCGRAAGDEQADPGPQLPEGFYRLLPHQNPAGISLAPAQLRQGGKGLSPEPPGPGFLGGARGCCISIWGLAPRASSRAGSAWASGEGAAPLKESLRFPGPARKAPCCGQIG